MTESTKPAVVIIPALNEERALPKVLDAIPRQWVEHILVVDNGSTDATAEVADRHGATVVSEPVRGYGAAMWRGMQEIERRWPATRIVVFLDGDASDHPECLAYLVGPIADNRADFTLGSRLLGEREPGALPAHSGWGNRFACMWIRLLTGQKYTDLGPFRAIRYDQLKQLCMRDRGFGWTVEMQIKAARQRLRILEVPVPYRKRIGTSKISGTVWGSLRAGAKILFCLARFAFS